MFSAGFGCDFFTTGRRGFPLVFRESFFVVEAIKRPSQGSLTFMSGDSRRQARKTFLPTPKLLVEFQWRIKLAVVAAEE
jgi:hypothetical protein